VLRKQPPGMLLQSAHDVEREYRVSTLWVHQLRVPPKLLGKYPKNIPAKGHSGIVSYGYNSCGSLRCLKIEPNGCTNCLFFRNSLRVPLMPLVRSCYCPFFAPALDCILTNIQCGADPVCFVIFRTVPSHVIGSFLNPVGSGAGSPGERGGRAGASGVRLLPRPQRRGDALLPHGVRGRQNLPEPRPAGKNLFPFPACLSSKIRSPRPLNPGPEGLCGGQHLPEPRPASKILTPPTPPFF